MTLDQRPLRSIYDFLSLKNSTILTADTIRWCNKILFPIDYFRFLFHRKNIILCLTVPPLSHLTSCTPTKSNLYLANSLATVVSEPDLYWLRTFQIPNLMSLFHCLGRTKGSVQVRGTCMFRERPGLTVRSCQHLAQPPVGVPHLVGCPRLLIQYIRSHLPYWRPFLLPEPVDAPCRGDRDPAIMEMCKGSSSFL